MRCEEKFRAMGCDVHLVIDGAHAGDDAAYAQDRIARLEAMWSRFIPESEVSRLNAAAGAPVIVSQETVELIARAIEGWRATAGRFDPLLLDAVVAAGYDRTFEEVQHSPGAQTGIRRAQSGISIDRIVGSVTLPEGAGFDPGGIGKGFAADIVTRELLDRGATGVCVNIGGDLRVAGTGGLTVGVEDPFGGPMRATIYLDEGGVATTSKVRRAWTRDGERLHHVIDPHTMTSARTDAAAVTVIAGDAWWAEVWAKAALLAGAHAWPGLAAGAGVTGLLIADDGAELAAPGFEAFV